MTTADGSVRLLDAQIPPNGNWRTWLLIGDRGSGKTFAAANWVTFMADTYADTSWAILGPTAGMERLTLDACVAQFDEGVQKYSRTMGHLELVNGSKIFVVPSRMRLRGLMVDGAVLEEVGLWDTSGVIDMLSICMRSSRSQVVATTTEYEPPGVRAVLGHARGLHSLTLPTLFGRV